MFECASCYDEYYYQEDCDEHMDDYGHWAECQTCDRRFRTHRAVEQHMNATNHWPRYECETCTSEFTSVAARDQHMRAEMHFERYCPDCDRHFMNRNNLHMVRSTTSLDSITLLDLRTTPEVDKTLCFKFNSSLSSA